MTSQEHKLKVASILKLFNLDKMSVTEFETWIKTLTNEVVEYHRQKHAEISIQGAEKAVQKAKQDGKLK